MKDNILFEVEEFNVQEVMDERYAIVQIFICHDGNNKHNLPIKLSTLKKAADTLKNAYIVGSFDGNDFEGHGPDEVIIGHFPESSKMTYKKKDGKTFLVAEAMMSKIYATWAYDQFVKQNHKGVSMEITVTKYGEEKDGLKEIKEFVFSGVTIIGDKRHPACEGADASIIKFDIENASELYGKYSWKSNVIAKQFVDSMGVETGKEGTEDMKENENAIVEEVVTESPEVIEGSVVETEVNVDVEPVTVVESTEKETTTEETVFEDKEKDKETEDDDKATMEKDDEEEESEEESDEDKEFESLTVEQKYTIFQAACKEAKYGYLESFDDEYVYCRDWEAGCTYRYSYTLSGTNVTLGTEQVRVVRGGYVPFTEITEEGGEATEPVVTENVATPNVEALQEEIAELKQTIAGFEDEKKVIAVEEILSSVVDVLPTDQVSDLREEAKEFALDNLSEFSNKVKAIAFESVKEKEGKYSFARIAFGEAESDKSTGKYSW